jgi:cobyrinic acid a,c-diamide synthase
MTPNRILLSAPSSASGKTTVTAAILMLLTKKNLRVQSFKTGPDYIDPQFHQHITKRTAYNLDSFFLDKSGIQSLFCEKTKDCDIAVVEGAMGYYDGISNDFKASAYEISTFLDINTIIVISPEKSAQTIAAVCYGLQNLRKNSNIKGIILNKIKPMQYNYYKNIITEITGLKALGYLPYDESISLESRHLGLIMANEIENLNNKLNKLYDIAKDTIDIDSIIEISKNSHDIEISNQKNTENEHFSDYNLAVAKDEAFCFYYNENLEILEKYGAKITYFSPIHDKKVPDNADGLYFGGGYPELYMDKLSENKSMLESVRSKFNNKVPILAECGGFMYLQKSFEDDKGNVYPLVNIIDSHSHMTKKLTRFGYTTLISKTDNILLNKGESIKGHEFHYSDSIDNGSDFIAKKANGREYECIFANENIFAGYPHIYLSSNEKAAQKFSRACVR